MNMPHVEQQIEIIPGRIKRHRRTGRIMRQDAPTLAPFPPVDDPQFDTLATAGKIGLLQINAASMLARLNTGSEIVTTVNVTMTELEGGAIAYGFYIDCPTVGTFVGKPIILEPIATTAVASNQTGTTLSFGPCMWGDCDAPTKWRLRDQNYCIDHVVDSVLGNSLTIRVTDADPASVLIVEVHPTADNLTLGCDKANPAPMAFSTDGPCRLPLGHDGPCEWIPAGMPTREGLIIPEVIQAAAGPPDADGNPPTSGLIDATGHTMDSAVRPAPKRYVIGGQLHRSADVDALLGGEE